MNILLTGGTGFIGSHTAVCLIEQGHQVVLYDNLCNSNAAVVDAIDEITGEKPVLVIGDIRDGDLFERTLAKHSIEAVIHFAGLKAVGESVEKPLDYYDNNIGGTVTMLKAMKKIGVKKMIFSSSSTVYGTPQKLPLTEDHPTGGVTNPYGRTKLMIEEILKDLAHSDPEWSIVCLRYFNPIGAHPSGLIGENPNGIPNNLLPYVARVASGQLEEVSVFGNDYPTPDGTGVRDYIHVVDLARGHACALKRFQEMRGCEAINLGTGNGYSVLQIIKAFEKACGKPIPYKIVQRRPGDIAANWADPSKARELLGWEAKYGIDEMCASAWNFETKLREREKQA
ncbi:MAG TPA: UDP-glucose 4-epimerase GalE [Sutterella sp.]|nr:UDP-glucose 4-epimerase GalE [Sutterella sp.]